MTRKLYIGLGILFTISISIFVFNAIYQGSVPKIVEEINNSSIGAILTAIITVLLLSQQSSSEEVKERNVSVFQKKSEKYEGFIDKIWTVWSDRVITKLELADLLKSFSKDVMLYAKKDTINTVLSSLERISEKAEPEKSSTEKQITEEIQKEVFNIIKVLASDLELGGSLEDDSIRRKLNNLEDAIYPALEEKRRQEEIRFFSKKYIEGLEEKLRTDNDSFEISEFKYHEKWRNVGFIQFKINNSNTIFRLFDIDKKDSKRLHYNIYVRRDDSLFNAYRNAIPYSGKSIFNQETLRNTVGSFDFDVNFSNYEIISNKLANYQDEDYVEKNDLGEKIIRIIDEIRIEGKTIFEIIEEIKNKK